MAKQIPLASITPTVGTWAMAVASNVWTLNKTAGDNTSILHIPLDPPQNSQAFAGAKVTSIELYYINATANLEAVTAKIYKTTLPAAGGSCAAAELASSVSGNLLTQAQQKMIITPTTPFYITEKENIAVELTIDAAAGSVVKIQGVVVNYTLRV
jgi:hypothetical protein